MSKKKRKLKNNIKIIFLLLIIVIGLSIFYIYNDKPKETIEKKASSTSLKKKKIIKEDSFTKECKKLNYCKTDLRERYEKYQDEHKDLSFEDVVTYVNLNLDYSFYTHTEKTPLLNKETILVNKYLYLGSDYIPENLEDIPTEYSRSGMKLVNIAKDKFVSMAKQAKADGYPIYAMSSYRSYEYQVNLYNRYAASDGVEAADTYSARAGYSEHQTGLCADVYDGKIDYTNFEKSKSFTWMQENAHKYGFILRFPKGKEHITGYQYESWHYRYVGEKIATYIHENNITFEEYYARFIEPTI